MELVEAVGKRARIQSAEDVDLDLVGRFYKRSPITSPEQMAEDVDKRAGIHAAEDVDLDLVARIY